MLSSPIQHRSELKTAALGVLFHIYSGQSIPISGSSSISLAGHSQPQPPWLRVGRLTFCPCYKIRRGMKCSRKYPRVGGTRLQSQHSSKERTFNADVNEPDQGPSSQGRGTFCRPCTLEHVAAPNPSRLFPPASHELPPQKHHLTFPEAVFLATPSASAQVWVPIPLLLKIPSQRRRILLIKSRELWSRARHKPRPNKDPQMLIWRRKGHCEALTMRDLDFVILAAA